MKIAVVGSRGFRDYPKLKKELDKINNENKISLVVSGGARGADSLGEKWAKENAIQTLIFKPKWEFGLNAGILRNKDIVMNSDFVLAFWDQKSPGTKHTINFAKQNKKKYKIVYF
jgi:hypothetical protein